MKNNSSRIIRTTDLLNLARKKNIYKDTIRQIDAKIILKNQIFLKKILTKMKNRSFCPGSFTNV